MDAVSQVVFMPNPPRNPIHSVHESHLTKVFALVSNNKEFPLTYHNVQKFLEIVPSTRERLRVYCMDHCDLFITLQKKLVLDGKVLDQSLPDLSGDLIIEPHPESFDLIYLYHIPQETSEVLTYVVDKSNPHAPVITKIN